MKQLLLALLMICPGICEADPVGGTLTPEEAEGRLRMTLQIARERNDKELVNRVNRVGKEILVSLKKGTTSGQDKTLRSLEEAVGIDPGGWSMAGQPLFRGTREMAGKLQALQPALEEAMETGNEAEVRKITGKMLAVLGDQAGVPDGRRAGRKSPALPMTEAEATTLFLEAMASEKRSIRQLKDGKLLPDQMVRLYASVLSATCEVRPFVVKHEPARVSALDQLTAGVAAILTGLQQPSGLFPFPDLRGKNIRFGEMTASRLKAGEVEIRDGWIVTADPDGGTQFDTGLCGNALLKAGRLYGKRDWTEAGLRAADWALAQPCCANFNYNAFSVSLLAHAYRITGDGKYLNGALQKFQVGVAPGQAPNGRWLDPHNARTVYHVIILRALGDLAGVLPADRVAERKELDRITRPAIEALLDEFDAMDLTVEALPELLTLQNLYPDDARLSKAVSAMTSGIIAKCTDGKRVKLGFQPNQLATVPRALAER